MIIRIIGVRITSKFKYVRISGSNSNNEEFEYFKGENFVGENFRRSIFQTKESFYRLHISFFFNIIFHIFIKSALKQCIYGVKIHLTKKEYNEYMFFFYLLEPSL